MHLSLAARGAATTRARSHAFPRAQRARVAAAPLAAKLDVAPFVVTMRKILTRIAHYHAWTRRGVASDNPVTVRGIAYIIAGHELHHRRILQEKYLPKS